uniref:Uncharacterized protein n=1 Tax=Arundo donax TaxID=35708 RepID=A0A0A9E848_ARUDO
MTINPTGIARSLDSLLISSS